MALPAVAARRERTRPAHQRSSGGLTLENCRSSARSYVAFRTPARTSGQPNGDTVSSQPDRSGATAEARLRGTAVTLAAAGRSSGVTTAMTYEERVGTSICDSRLRRISNANAIQTVGA